MLNSVLNFHTVFSAYVSVFYLKYLFFCFFSSLTPNAWNRLKKLNSFFQSDWGLLIIFKNIIGRRENLSEKSEHVYGNVVLVQIGDLVIDWFKLELKTQLFDSVHTNCWTWTVTHLLTTPYTLIRLIGRAHQRVRASKSVGAAVSSICTSTYLLFILRMMLQCLEPVHQFEEFIFRYSTAECQRK